VQAIELRAELEKQLAALAGQPKGKALRISSSLKGRKVPPKYRSRSGETWAGRGARPRWLVEALKKGKKMDDFLIKRQRG
jgi:DNA-binding protein H-NS